MPAPTLPGLMIRQSSTTQSSHDASTIAHEPVPPAGPTIRQFRSVQRLAQMRLARSSGRRGRRASGISISSGAGRRGSASVAAQITHHSTRQSVHLLIWTPLLISAGSGHATSVVPCRTQNRAVSRACCALTWWATTSVNATSTGRPGAPSISTGSRKVSPLTVVGVVI